MCIIPSSSPNQSLSIICKVTHFFLFLTTIPHFSSFFLFPPPLYKFSPFTFPPLYSILLYAFSIISPLFPAPSFYILYLFYSFYNIYFFYPIFPLSPAFLSRPLFPPSLPPFLPITFRKPFRCSHFLSLFIFFRVFSKKVPLKFCRYPKSMYLCTRFRDGACFPPV